MAVPTHFFNRFFFYPFGNTLPRFLTEDQPFDHGGEDLKILVLGVGDMRSVFVTSQCHEALLGERETCLKFTLCDVEPAILARNLIVSKLFIESTNEDPNRRKSLLKAAWAIHYHHFLESSELGDLKRVCHDLLSQSCEWFTFSSEKSEIRVRRLWEMYAGDTAKEIKVKAFEKDRDSVLNTSELRAKRGQWLAQHGIAPFHDESRKAEIALERLTTTYFKIGNVWDNRSVALHVNPTLFYTENGGCKYSVHYSLSPHCGFNFARMVDNQSIDHQSFISEMLEQFNARGLAFARLVARKLVHVDYFVGDALEFCRALYIHPHPFKFNNGSLEPVRLKRTCATRFHVIETSNLVDHLGLANVLTHTLPLLSEQPFSRIRTLSLWPR
jgi:hypothetical protein